MIYSATLPAQAAGGADATTLAGVYSSAFYSGDTVTDVQLVAPPGYAMIVGAATNNATISVRQLRNGVVLQTFASLTLTTGMNLSPEIPVTVPLTSQPVLHAGDVLDVQMRQNGTGQTIASGLHLSVFVS
jgi:predicted cobalt transporter CbtA